MSARLAAKIVEVLSVGGPRKPAILLALARKLGCTEAQFKDVVYRLKHLRVISTKRRHGGAHYALARLNG